MTYRFLATLLLALAPAGGFADTAAAPAAPAGTAGGVANDTAFGDWRVACRALGADQTDCRLVQTLTRTADQTLVVRFIAVPRPEGGTVMVAQMPMGAFLAQKPALRMVEPKDSPEQAFTWQRCFKDVCEAAIVLSADEVAAMSKGDKALFGYKIDPKADPIVAPVNMGQLDTGLAAVTPKTGQ